MRRFIYILIFLLGVVLVVSQAAEFEQIAITLRQGLWYWLALAVLVQAVYLLNQAVAYGAAFRTAGAEHDLRTLLPLAVAANFVNVVTVSGVLGGMALFAGEARRRNQSAAQVTVGGVLFWLCDYTAFLAVLALGLVVLLRRSDLSVADGVAAAIMVGFALALGLVLALGLRSAQDLERLLVRAVRLVNRLLRPVLRRAYLSEATAREFATDTAEAFAIMRRQPLRRWLAPLALALTGKALLMTVLLLVFLAFRQPFTGGVLIAGFSLAYLFLIVSPTPSGLGVVEGALPLALRSLRVPLGSAVVITLAYRGITFWLPFLYGFVAWRWLGREPARPRPTAGGPTLAGDESDFA